MLKTKQFVYIENSSFLSNLYQNICIHTHNKEFLLKDNVLVSVCQE